MGHRLNGNIHARRITWRGCSGRPCRGSHRHRSQRRSARKSRSWCVRCRRTRFAFRWITGCALCC